MGLRFQQHMKLFPGLRLNFSRSGISATVGVRGAGLTLGARGAYVNLGIPGTGLSYRERIDRPIVGVAHVGGSNPDDSPQLAEDYIGQRPSNDVLETPNSGLAATMTDVGLDEIKTLINEARQKRIELLSTVAHCERRLRLVQLCRQLAQLPIIRLFTKSLIQRLTANVSEADGALNDARHRLSACHVEVDFALDEPTKSAFAALERSFRELTTCQRAWDITTSGPTIERTAATESVTRRPVTLDVFRSVVIDSDYHSMRFLDVHNNSIIIYPGFALVARGDTALALIDVRNLKVDFYETMFIERRDVPSDAELIGQTWLNANKDGSRDRRFANNYEIPMARYGECEFRSENGLFERYQFSCYQRALSFYRSLVQYQQSIAKLAERSVEQGPFQLTSSEGHSEHGEQRSHVSDQYESRPANGLVQDDIHGPLQSAIEQHESTSDERIARRVEVETLGESGTPNQRGNNNSSNFNWAALSFMVAAIAVRSILRSNHHRSGRKNDFPF